jgi:hypothetical protein
VDLTKIEAMQNWPHHKNIKNLCDFMGLTGYYCKFVENYGKIVAPLTNPLAGQCYHAEHSHTYIYNMHIKSN